MFTKDDIRTLFDVVIVSPIQVNLLPQLYATQSVVGLDVAQAKERSY